MVSSSANLKKHCMSRLLKEFAMKDWSPLSFFLGISFKRTHDRLFMSQSRYALEILDRAKMRDCNPVLTPVDTAGKLGSQSGDLYEILCYIVA
jgi:hypothetical protein